jgi:hypothetical protein
VQGLMVGYLIGIESISLLHQVKRRRRLKPETNKLRGAVEDRAFEAVRRLCDFGVLFQTLANSAFI